LTEAYGLRLQVYQDFGAVQQLHESSKFESAPARRERLIVIDNTVQRLFLHLLAIVQHRPDLRPFAAPEPLRAASVRFRTTLAEMLLNLADWVEGKAERAMPDLPSALAELEKTVAAQINAVADVNVAVQIRARLALYQETARLAVKLAGYKAG
jgi:hypothetical protein